MWGLIVVSKTILPYTLCTLNYIHSHEFIYIFRVHVLEFCCQLNVQEPISENVLLDLSKQLNPDYIFPLKLFLLYFVCLLCLGNNLMVLISQGTLSNINDTVFVPLFSFNVLFVIGKHFSRSFQNKGTGIHQVILSNLLDKNPDQE